MDRRTLELEECLVNIVSSMWHGDFKVETPNERVWFAQIQDLGMWPTDEDHLHRLFDAYRHSEKQA